LRRVQVTVVQRDDPKCPGNTSSTTSQQLDAERLPSTTSTLGFTWLVKDDPEAEEGTENGPEGARNSVKFVV